MGQETTRQHLHVHIRWLIRRDLPEVLAIEQESFEFPWTENEFRECLTRRNCVGMVAQWEERIVGYMIYELAKSRIHLLNLAVGSQFRRRGIASQMVAKLISKLTPERRNKIVLTVRETNLAAQLFFRANGFRAVSILHDYYDDSSEDAYLMQYVLAPVKPVEMFYPVNRIARFMNRQENV